VTCTLPLTAVHAKVTVIEAVPAPLVIVAPDGNVHAYDAAPVTAEMDYGCGASAASDSHGVNGSGNGATHSCGDSHAGQCRGSITGHKLRHSRANLLTYSISAVTGAASYAWTLPRVRRLPVAPARLQSLSPLHAQP